MYLVFTTNYFPWLTIIVVFPIAAGSLIFFFPHRGNKVTRGYTIYICVLELLLMTYAFCYHFQLDDPLIQLAEDYNWINFFFFIMWELELIPVYLLLSMWGGKKRLYSATKFILYTAAGSVFLLIGVLGIGLYGSNEPTLNLETLANQSYPVALEIIFYIGFFYCFCCQIGLLVLHFFFLAGTSYDRIRLGYLDEMGGLAIPIPKIFTIFSILSMASLALPGMSGFVAELIVFFGIITSQKYFLMSKILITFVMAIGMILTPIYSLSMSRQMFYGYKLFNPQNSYFF
uniref:NADH-plastoquinone oxidoreductase subunit 4 n=1 Tax=Commiphora foliacea TaxID=1173001 RepID=A0A410PA35_9ROSI|nr:NADH-plastoquinone oxidoreductase subunit 4 [Commiphora foliacea]QAT19657.1 NADH-plastoquinone oxidoreductase subunit 4 [Commiphora foliacea]